MPSPTVPSILDASRPAIDPESLGELREELDTEDFLRILTLYLHKLPTRVAEVRGALAGRDAPALARAAHPLKSSSRQMGALLLGGLCERLELAGQAGTPEQVAELDTPLEQEAAAVQTALRWVVENS
ncbi:MAG: Hpt domain-containing protein [Magnetococcus sp. DMHC-8]